MATNVVVQDHRKHALEALERRFAVAKAEVQQQLSKKRRHNEEEKTVNLNSPVSSVRLAFDSPASLSNTSSKKDIEADAPTYQQICQPVHDNLITAPLIPTEGKRTVDKVLHELLKSGDSAQKYMQGSRNMKIDNWILLDNVVQKRDGASASRLKALQSHSKRSKKHMSMKQLKKCGVFEFPDKLRRFDDFMPLHEMWKGYVTQLLRHTGKNQIAQSLLSADMHGAILQVVGCKIESFIGVTGIMIRETAETFGLITRENKFKVVPKRISVFVLQADSWKVTMHGDKLASREL